MLRRAMKTEDFNVIRSTSLFSELSDDLLRSILGNEPPHDYPKNKILFQQGDEADHFYIVLSGWVKLYRQLSSGEEAILHVFTSGESFAEAAMFNGHRYPATAEIVSDARLVSINCNHFERQLRETPRIAMGMLASTALHMKQLVTEIEQIKGRNSAERLAFFLLKMCPEHAISAVVELPYEKSLIASRLGIQPESLSRLLNKLRGYGVNSIKNQVIISDVAKLRNLAMGDEPPM